MSIIRKHNQGFTLLEIMIAVFVLSIGLLGLAHLQVVTLKTTQSADFKTQASILATDILNRMRANKDAAYGGDYAIGLGDAPPAPNSIANTDISEWRGVLANEIPNGLGSIACPVFAPLTAYICTVTITWNDIQTGVADGTNYNERATSTFVMDSAI